MEKRSRICKEILKECLIIAGAWYTVAATIFNFYIPSIDYSHFRFQLKKEKTAIVEQYKPNKTYAIFIVGFPNSNPGIRKDEVKTKKAVDELNKNRNIEAALISYKDCENGRDLLQNLEEKIAEFSEKVTKEDAFVFGYNGHGEYSPKGVNLSLGNNTYIAPCSLNYYLSLIDAKYNIVIISSCYSKNFENLKGKNRIIILSESKGKVTTSFGGFTSDVFSNKKEADKDKNGKVSLEESFIYAAENDWFTNYANVFLQLPRQCPQLLSKGIEPNAVYLFDK